jgi:hypothetical protein
MLGTIARIACAVCHAAFNDLILLNFLVMYLLLH